MDKFYQWLAWLLPRRLVYFAGIRLWANATTGKFSSVDAPTVTVDDALREWKDGSDENSYVD